ncbi:hypothetical protein V1527DRAFT_151949 [Lipomyces starkeyi]
MEIYSCSWPGCTKWFVQQPHFRVHIERHRTWSSVDGKPQDESIKPHNSDSVGDHPITRIDKQRWITSTERLRNGYTSRHKKACLPPAVITPSGCQLVQKKTSAGYCRILPVAVFTGVARKVKGEPRKIKDLPKLPSRTAASDSDVLYKGYEASHLCQQPACINPDHLVVESHQAHVSGQSCSTTKSRY